MLQCNENSDDPPSKKTRLTSSADSEQAEDDVICMGSGDEGRNISSEVDSNQRETLSNELDSARREALTDFVAITNAEEDAALSILDSSNWDVNRALDFFFGNGEDEVEEVAQNESQSTRVSGPSDLADMQSGEESAPIDLTGLEVSLVSWNIDGLDGNSLATRMKAVYKIVSNLNPDFVFLQEVVSRELPTIDRLSKLYDIFYSNKDYLYYTAILVSKMFDVDRHEVIHYQNSGMGRTLQILEGRIGVQKVFLLNTHLESMREHSRQRKEQFKTCMERIESIISRHPNCLLFFGGDLNIRDDEISGVPRGVADAWLAAGAKKDTEFTWDTRKNDNKHSFGARNRFDRIFWYGPLTRVKFSLAGQQRIRSCLCFPSDHWAVHCEFSS